MARLARGSCAGWPRCGRARWRSGATASTCARRGLDITCPTRSERDIADEAQVNDALQRHRPWAVVNAAALAQAPEGDATTPACLLGLSKAEAERRVASAHGEALVIRMTRLFGSGDDPRALAPGRARGMGTGTLFTATYVPDIVRVALDPLIDGEAGTWHLASKGAVSRREMARIFPMEVAEEQPAERLVMLGSERALLMPSLIEALERHKDLMAQGCAGVAA